MKFTAPKADLPLTAEVNFKSVKDLILTTNCITCHKQYDSYSETLKDAQKIIDEVEADRMPKNRAALSENQKNFLKEWVRLGAPEGPTDTPDDGVLRPNWKSISTKLLGSKCIQCHNPNGEAKFLDLSTREAIWKERARLFDFDRPETSYLLEIIQSPDEPMPPVWSGIPRLDEKEIDVLRQWIESGLP